MVASARKSVLQALVLLCFGPCLADSATAQGAPKVEASYEFSIPAGKLVAAIDRLRAQSGVQVMYETSLGEVAVPALKGTYTVRAALAQLLEKSGVRVENTDDKTVVLKRVNSTSSLSPAHQMRVTSLAEQSKSGGAVGSGSSESDGSQVTVKGERDKPAPWRDSNLDIPRTMDDVQPYFIFDRDTLQKSGAPGLEEFLKYNLTMNTSMRSAQQQPQGGMENNSSINLRGLGENKTLILVNGRRMANVQPVQTSGDSRQPDLNSIPLSAIDRIEVLPTSASGIYGGNAMGGVVNVILRRDYKGGEVRATYDNAWGADAPRRTLTGSYGFSLFGGRTNVMLNASWNDMEQLVLRDRAELVDAGIGYLLKYNPSVIYSGTVPLLGSRTNILASPSTRPALVLDDGTVLPSRLTHIPAGITRSTSPTALAAALAANAGTWNETIPDIQMGPNGWEFPIDGAPGSHSASLSLTHQLRPGLELTLEYMDRDNELDSTFPVIPNTVTIQASAPNNPFNHAVILRVPLSQTLPRYFSTRTRSATAGLTARLPRDWMVIFDYSWSQVNSESRALQRDSTYTSALLSGALNFFVDTASDPVDLTPYLRRDTSRSSYEQQNITLRGSGPAFNLPWGAVRVTAGLDHNVSTMPNNYNSSFHADPLRDYEVITFSRKSELSGLYAEANVPLVKQGGHWPLLHEVELQIAGRQERVTSSGGSFGYFNYFNNPANNGYNGTQLPWQDTTYEPNNHTIGLKYQPVAQLTLRASMATAFVPPAPYSLLRNDTVYPGSQTVHDPVLNTDVTVGQFTYGGNPDLKPENSDSTNIGLIWEPSSVLKGLRVNVEYYRVKQSDALVSSPTGQLVVDLESSYPERVQRDTGGNITQLDLSYLNLYASDTDGWDVNLDYRMQTAFGGFGFNVMGTFIESLRTQYSLTAPSSDTAGYPNEGGAAKRKFSGRLTWDRGPFSATWSTQYLGSYYQIGVAGGPTSLRYANGAAIGSYVAWQGSETIDSQIYHDVAFAYDFGRAASSTGGSWLTQGLQVQGGVKNLFDRIPPLDVYNTGLYLSQYGDRRLRSYWLSVSKRF